MKLTIALNSFLCATVVFSQVQVPLHASDDTDLKVPGENPLYFEHDPTENNYILKLDQLDLSPNPPTPGNTLNIYANGLLSKVVDEGSFAHVEVKWGLISLLSMNFDLCENADKVGEQCPFHQGVWNVTKEVELPSQIPPGKYTVVIRAYADKEMEEVISCMKGDVMFRV